MKRARVGQESIVSIYRGGGSTGEGGEGDRRGRYRGDGETEGDRGYRGGGVTERGEIRLTLCNKLWVSNTPAVLGEELRVPAVGLSVSPLSLCAGSCPLPPP
ncbi:hypothetical protein FKM82_028498 [Ascaphus truei]